MRFTKTLLGGRVGVVVSFLVDPGSNHTRAVDCLYLVPTLGFPWNNFLGLGQIINI